LPDEKQPQKEQIKVTDKRIFTPEGEIKEEFRAQIHPSTASSAPRIEQPPQPAERRAESQAHSRVEEERRKERTLADKAANPGTPFTNFLEPLIAQAYMSLGMLPNPYQPQTKPDVAAARQMIEILSLLHEKTAGNLTPDEQDFLDTHIGELKLAFVKRTKSI
jgi:hypothetical protein